jgi:hypothetical protein
MGAIRKAASILTLGGVSSHDRRDPQEKAAKAQAELEEAETKVAEEQAAAIARALHEDEAHRQADLEEVAEKEAEAVPWSGATATATAAAINRTKIGREAFRRTRPRFRCGCTPALHLASLSDWSL